jgi:hypothetical protein
VLLLGTLRSLLNRKAKGDLAELKVAADLRARGYKVAFPYGEDWEYIPAAELGRGISR